MRTVWRFLNTEVLSFRLETLNYVFRVYITWLGVFWITLGVTLWVTL